MKVLAGMLCALLWACCAPPVPADSPAATPSAVRQSAYYRQAASAKPDGESSAPKGGIADPFLSHALDAPILSAGLDVDAAARPESVFETAAGWEAPQPENDDVIQSIVAQRGPGVVHGPVLLQPQPQPTFAQPGPALILSHGSDPCGVCGTCGPVCCACPDCGWTLFGEFIFLTARGVDVHFATPIDGLGVNAVPVDRVLVADPDYDAGFRVGGSKPIGRKTRLVGMYSYFRSSVNDLDTLPGGTGLFLATLVHPNTTNVAADSLSAEAGYEIDFDLADLALSHRLWSTCRSRLDGVAGFRYARLDQDLTAIYSILGVTSVDSDIDFAGFGPRLGLDAERVIGGGFSVYANSFANLLVGTFDATYTQRNVNVAPLVQAQTGLEDDRIVPQLELEVGLAFRHPCGYWRANIGYYIAGWFNTVTTPAFIDAVQADNFSNVGDTLTFDGLAARLEFRF